MNINKKESYLNLIKKNINDYGFHLTTVNNILEPRYSYTNGLKEKFGFELIFAGGIYYLLDDLNKIFEAIFIKLKKYENKSNLKFEINHLGTFSLLHVDHSWTKTMMLGVFDYYKIDKVDAFQIMPDKNHFTLDIPDMSKKYDSHSEAIWKWLTVEWNYKVPKNSTVITNLKSLFGEVITEVSRWEINEWEMFAGSGPDVKNEEMRVVSLATILGIDETLIKSIDVEVGKGIWRDSLSSGWNEWI